MIIPVIITTIPSSKIETLKYDQENEIVKYTVNKVKKNLRKRPLIVYDVTTYSIVTDLTDKDFLIFNPKPNSKLSYSIKLVTEWIMHNYSMNVTGIMFFLAQQPMVPDSIINDEIKLFRNNEDNFVIVKSGNKYGYPIVVGKAYFDYLIKLDDNLTSKRFLNKISNILIVKGDKESIELLDTMKKYEKLKEILQS